MNKLTPYFLKSFFAMCLITLGLGTAIAQYNYEATEEYPFGRPNPEAPGPLTDYQELIGICECKSTARKQDGAWAEAIDMTWEFRYIMNGMAVQDLTLKSDGKHSGSIRQFNADSAKWYIHYYATSSNAVQLPAWSGNKRDGNIELYMKQKAPNGKDGYYKIVFSEISPTGFQWQGAWVSLDESFVYPTWKIDCKKRKR